MVPVSHCSVCDNDVKAFSDGGSNTVFEVDGRFLQKSGKPSQACGREQFLRNPPVFMKYAIDGTLEVEALLDHLFRQNNTPMHVAKRLIPRFVTSNP